MNTCDTCKHWGRETDEPGFRECEAAGGTIENEATVANGEPYNGGIVATGPRFGCIHHKAKMSAQKLWCAMCGKYTDHQSGKCPELATPSMSFVIDQRFVDRIVARAQNSMMGLGEPEGSYSLAKYCDSPTFESVAILLVSAHTAKYDLVSLMCAAMEEVEKLKESLK